jgi:hypothetical protein
MHSKADHRFDSPTGQMEVWTPCETILVARIVGTLDMRMAEWFLGVSAPWMAQSPRLRCAFQDWEQMRDYETQARVHFATWTMRYRAQFQSIHLLVRSRILAMGAEMTSAAIGNVMVVHSERPPFLAALREAVAREGAVAPF